MKTDVHSMHARATGLARSAMAAAALLPATGESDYARAQRIHREACERSRADGIARGRAHNLDLRVQSHIRRFGGYQDALPF